MPRLPSLVSLAAALLAVGGCCRDTIREMASLKDGIVAPRTQERSAKAAPQRQTQSAAVVREDDGESIETGSIDKRADCQGQHLAYQATKEYLKNFGPKPPDLPGERGPCNPNPQ